MAHGLRAIRTLPNALVYVTAVSFDVMRHDRSVGTGPASMMDGSPCIMAGGRSRVLSRTRSARGLTNEMSNGRVGSRLYSVPGNSDDAARWYTTSTLLNDRVGPSA